MTIKKTVVKLKAKDVKDSKPVEFEVSQAIRLLSFSNSQWELADKDFKFNGTEITKL